MTRHSGNRDAVTSEDDIVRSTLDDHTVAVLREAAAVRGLPIDQLIAALLRAATAHLDELLDYAPGVVVSEVTSTHRRPSAMSPDEGEL
ncbi:MAG: hypothetical protein ACT452_13305 [Microthrixaceae bacterium]